MHLVLATQRPGVSSAPTFVRTPASGLRCASPTQANRARSSTSRTPPSFPHHARSRLRTTCDGWSHRIQTARVGASEPIGAAPTSVRHDNWRTSAIRCRTPVSAESGPTDLAVGRLSGRRSDNGSRHPPGERLVVAAADVITLDQLPAMEADDVIPLGLCDLPAQQAQRPFAIDLADGGHLLVAGGPRSAGPPRCAPQRDPPPVGSRHRTAMCSGFDCASGGLGPCGRFHPAGR